MYVREEANNLFDVTFTEHKYYEYFLQKKKIISDKLAS